MNNFVKIFTITMCLAANAQAQSFKTDSTKKQIKVTGYSKSSKTNGQSYNLLNEQGTSNLTLVCDSHSKWDISQIFSANGSIYVFPDGVSACSKTLALLDFVSKGRPLIITVTPSSTITAQENQNDLWVIQDVTFEQSIKSSKVSSNQKKSLIELGRAANLTNTSSGADPLSLVTKCE